MPEQQQGRRWGWVAALALAGSVSLGSVSPGATEAESPAPRLEAPETERSFGVVTPDFHLEESFLLRNVGQAPLVLGVHPPAGRARVLESPRELAPGEEGVVRVSADLRRQRGPVEIPFRVATNDPENPRLELTLVGEVKHYVEARPGHGRWLMVRGEVDGPIRQSLTAADGQPFEVVRVEVPHEWMRAELTQQEEAWTVDLIVDRWAPVGPVTGEAVVHTTHPEQPRVLIPVSGFVRPIVTVDPPELVGEVEILEVGEQEIRIRSFATDPIALIRVEHAIPGVPPAQVREVEAGRVFFVVLELGPEIPKGRLESELRIFTDHPQVPEIHVPVSALIR